jgi:hypothetical protein
VAFLLSLVAVLASYVPACRASKLDPISHCIRIVPPTRKGRSSKLRHLSEVEIFHFHRRHHHVE